MLRRLHITDFTTIKEQNGDEAVAAMQEHLREMIAFIKAVFKKKWHARMPRSMPECQKRIATMMICTTSYIICSNKFRRIQGDAA